MGLINGLGIGLILGVILGAAVVRLGIEARLRRDEEARALAASNGWARRIIRRRQADRRFAKLRF